MVTALATLSLARLNYVRNWLELLRNTRLLCRGLQGRREEGSVSFMGNERYAASWRLTS
jgi:hypothetical protein